MASCAWRNTFIFSTNSLKGVHLQFCPLYIGILCSQIWALCPDVWLSQHLNQPLVCHTALYSVAAPTVCLHQCQYCTEPKKWKVIPIWFPTSWVMIRWWQNCRVKYGADKTPHAARQQASNWRGESVSFWFRLKTSDSFFHFHVCIDLIYLFFFFQSQQLCLISIWCSFKKNREVPTKYANISLESRILTSSVPFYNVCCSAI